MHQKLEQIYHGNRSILEDSDKEIVHQIEQKVSELMSNLTNKEIKTIVKIDSFLYEYSSLEKQKTNLLARNEIISNLIKKAKEPDVYEDAKYWYTVKPFEQFNSPDNNDTLITIFNLADTICLNELSRKLKELEKHNEEKIKNIDEILLDNKKNIEKAKEVISKNPSIKNYFDYKEVKNYKFEIDNNGKLLKISRLEGVLKYSVVYFDSINNNERNKMVLYSGKKDRVIGFGKFGKVKLVQNYDNNRWYALKIQNILPEKIHLLEIDNLKKVDMHYDNVDLESRYKSYIAMTLAPGVEAFSLISEDLLLNPDKDMDIVRILLASAKELQSLHDRKIIHRDVKLENFVYDDKTDKCTLIDVQFLATVDDNGVYLDTKYMGTPGFIDEEIHQNGEFIYSKGSDIYAFGNILRQLREYIEADVDNSTHKKEMVDLLVKYSDSFTAKLLLRSKDLNSFISEASKLCFTFKDELTKPLLLNVNREKIKELLFSSQFNFDQKNSPSLQKTSTAWHDPKISPFLSKSSTDWRAAPPTPIHALESSPRPLKKSRVDDEAPPKMRPL